VRVFFLPWLSSSAFSCPCCQVISARQVHRAGICGKPWKALASSELHECPPRLHRIRFVDSSLSVCGLGMALASLDVIAIFFGSSRSLPLALVSRMALATFSPLAPLLSLRLVCSLSLRVLQPLRQAYSLCTPFFQCTRRRARLDLRLLPLLRRQVRELRRFGLPTARRRASRCPPLRSRQLSCLGPSRALRRRTNTLRSLPRLCACLGAYVLRTSSPCCTKRSALPFALSALRRPWPPERNTWRLPEHT
jgi:hypothetical protein